MTGVQTCALPIYWEILDFGFLIANEDDKNKSIKLAKKLIDIGYQMSYDLMIKKDNLKSAMYSLTILKFVYKIAKQNSFDEILEEVLKYYGELESHLKRPERNDLVNAQELVKYFRDDLDNYNLSFPPLSKKLMEIIYK